MVNFERYTLANGLTVILYPDLNVPSAVINVLYGVGSRDESEEMTGFAHLFEHLMFGGSKNIPIYDEPLQRVGGENNAFTSSDITNYYLTIPAANIETGIWLEADRMLQLAFSQESLEIQQKVVIEEFNQRYLNQPYGDVWLHLWPLSYQKHPYRWPTIGSTIKHIEDAKLEDVKAFFNKHYSPANAVLVVAGNFEHSQVKQLIDNHFSFIPNMYTSNGRLPQESEQVEARRKIIEQAVPLDALYQTYHIPGRKEDSFMIYDILSDILGRGKQSYLYNLLVVKNKIFTSMVCYHTGTADTALLVIEGKVNKGVDLEDAELALQSALESFQLEGITTQALEQARNQALSTHAFSRLEVLNLAMQLAYYEWLGDADQINTEEKLIEEVTLEQVVRAAQTTLKVSRSNTLLYKAV